jgi:hypothetical protein
MEAVLRRLYTAVFVTGSQCCVADMVAAILAVPLPQAGSTGISNSEGSHPISQQTAANHQELSCTASATLQQEQGAGAPGGAAAGALVVTTAGTSNTNVGGSGSRKRRGRDVCFLMAGRTFRLEPPCPSVGVPVPELPLRPLLEALSVDHLITVFLAGGWVP